jgi:hypothetical protein
MNMHTPNHVIHSAGAVRYSWLIENFGTVFNFLFTIVIKVLILCTENPKFFIEVLDELELLIDKKVIIEEKKISVGPPRRLPSAVILFFWENFLFDW